MTTVITTLIVLTSLTLIWRFFSEIRKFFEYMVKRQPDSENESKGKLKLQWLKNVWSIFALLFLGLNLLVILFVPGIYWGWVTNHLNTYMAVELGLIILISVFIATEGKKQGGLRLLALLVILGVTFIGLGQEPEVAKSFAEVIPQAKATSTQVTPQPLQQYVIVAPPAPNWSQPLPKEIADEISKWYVVNFQNTEGETAFNWKLKEETGKASTNEPLQTRKYDYWPHLQLQSKTDKEVRITLTRIK